MTTITFTASNATIEVESVHMNADGDTIYAGSGHDYDAYGYFGVKSIIPPKQKAPTDLQNQFMNQLQREGYIWDKQHSTAAAGVVVKRQSDGDFWFFGMEGEIMHNPDGITIKL